LLPFQMKQQQAHQKVSQPSSGSVPFQHPLDPVNRRIDHRVGNTRSAPSTFK
jgi:hypothetical protein